MSTEQNGSKAGTPSPERLGSAVYVEGVIAFESGVVVGDNPYPEHSEDHWHWMGGWADAGIKKIKSKMQNTRRD